MSEERTNILILRRRTDFDPLLQAESPEAREARWGHAVRWAARFPQWAEAAIKDCEKRRSE